MAVEYKDANQLRVLLDSACGEINEAARLCAEVFEGEGTFESAQGIGAVDGNNWGKFLCDFPRIEDVARRQPPGRLLTLQVRGQTRTLKGSKTMNDNVHSVIEGLRWIRERSGDTSFQRPSVPYLLGAINAVPSGEEKSMLLSILAIEYAALGLTELQVYALRSSAELSPSDPSPWIDLSDVHRLGGDLEQSISDAKTAVTLAKSAGRYHRHALQTLARSLRASNLYSDLERVLDTLMSLPRTTPDSAIESDFLVDLPDGAVSSAKIDAYKSLSTK